MKKLFTLCAIAAIAPVAWSAEYSVFRVCEDQHVIRTADGAEAGHVEYIVLESSSRRIVSTLVTGGTVGSKLVAVPFSSMRFAGEKEITLTEINRERLVSAPAIESSQVTTWVREPAAVERTFTHFGIRADSEIGTSSTSDIRTNTSAGTSTDVRTNATDPARNTGATSRPAGQMPPQDSSRPQSTQPATQTNPAGKNAATSTTPPEPVGEKKSEKKDKSQPQSNQPPSPQTQPSSPQTQQPGQAPQPQGKPGSAAEQSRDKSDRTLDKAQEKSDRTLDKGQEKSDRSLNKAQEKSDQTLDKAQEKSAGEAAESAEKAKREKGAKSSGSESTSPE